MPKTKIRAKKEIKVLELGFEYYWWMPHHTACTRRLVIPAWRVLNIAQIVISMLEIEIVQMFLNKKLLHGRGNRQRVSASRWPIYTPTIIFCFCLQYIILSSLFASCHLLHGSLPNMISKHVQIIPFPAVI